MLMQVHLILQQRYLRKKLLTDGENEEAKHADIIVLFNQSKILMEQIYMFQAMIKFEESLSLPYSSRRQIGGV